MRLIIAFAIYCALASGAYAHGRHHHYVHHHHRHHVVRVSGPVGMVGAGLAPELDYANQRWAERPFNFFFQSAQTFHSVEGVWRAAVHYSVTAAGLAAGVPVNIALAVANIE